MAWTLARFLRDFLYKTIKMTGKQLVIFCTVHFIINTIEVSNSSILDHPFPFYCVHLVRPKQTIVFFFWGGGRGGIYLVVISFS